MSFFRASRSGSASIAKDRLQILVAHERAQRHAPSYLPQLQKELLEVIRKYVDVDQDALTINLEQEDNCEILELNVVLPEAEKRVRAPASR
jgi:cell division topological specificity factor